MERIENEELLEYVKQETFNKLNDCKLFKTILKPKQIRKNLDKNILKVYTNEADNIAIAYFENRRIVICKSGENGRILTKEDIKKKKLEESIVHEGIHAVLNHKDNKGTGILRENIGNGFNEGYTNWVLEKIGFKTKTYNELTNIVKQIEIAIGKETLIKFGKKKHKQIAKDMNMTQKEFIKFLLQMDEINLRVLILRELQYIDKYYDIVQEIEQKGETKKLQAQKEIIYEYIKDTEYFSYLEQELIKKIYQYSGEKDYTKYKQDILRQEFIFEEERVLQYLKYQVENKIYNHLFKDKFKQILENRDTTQKEFEECEEYFKLSRKVLSTEENCRYKFQDKLQKLEQQEKLLENKRLELLQKREQKDTNSHLNDKKQEFSKRIKINLGRKIKHETKFINTEKDQNNEKTI